MLNAVICAWNEEDIIGACVKHALAQGCENVFLIDNASTDKTIQQAVRAGAVYHASFTTDQFDETQKTLYINKTVQEITVQLPGEKNWWLYIDADEFPDFDTGKTIKETLSALPPDARAVGGYVCNHVPTHEPQYQPGLHPVDFMPVGTPVSDKPWKLNLLRHDKNKPPLFSGSGAHTYNSSDSDIIIEADDRFILHHFPYRKHERTKKRLKLLVSPDKTGKRRVDDYDKRSRIFGSERCHYHSRLEKLDQLYAQSRYDNLKTEKLAYNFPQIIRWYDPLSVELTDPTLSNADRALWHGSLAYFMGDFNAALFRLHDALETVTDEYKKGLLLVGMARCYANLNDPAYQTIVDILKKSPLSGIKELAAGM